MASDRERDRTEERVDPRVTRTKAELGDALMDLMQKRRWEKIRVQDILDQTGISRSAFYAHYGNKFDLLIDRVPDLHVPFDDDEPNFLMFFEHINALAPMMRPILSQTVFGEIMARAHRSLVEMWTEYFADTEHADDWMLPEFLAGALLAIVRAYAEQREREDPAVVSGRFDHLRAQVIASR